jgi:hypothetical protein
MGLQVQRPELVQTEDHLRLAPLRHHLAVGDRIEMFHPGLLRGVVRITGGLPGLYPLKRHPFRAQQHAQAFMADVLDHPLGDQEIGQLGQTPGRERRAVLGRRGLGDLLDLPALRERERGWPATSVLGIQRIDPSVLKLWITSRTRSSLVNATSAIRATGMPCADSNTICARRQVTTDPEPRRIIRNNRCPSSSSRSRTWTRSATLHSLKRSHHPVWDLNRRVPIKQGKPCLTRH